MERHRTVAGVAMAASHQESRSSRSPQVPQRPHLRVGRGPRLQGRQRQPRQALGRIPGREHPGGAGEYSFVAAVGLCISWGAVVDVVAVDDPGSADFGAAGAVLAAVDAELYPGDPPVPRAERAAVLLDPPAHRPTRLFLATDGGEPVGTAVVIGPLAGANDGMVDVAVSTHPAHRRRGIGHLLASVGLAAAAEDGATSILARSHAETGDAFCERLGLTRRLEERFSRLRVADVDETQQRSWIEDAPARAAGYRLERWIGVCPSDRLAALATALDAML